MDSFAARVRRALLVVIGSERLRSDPLFDAEWYRWAYPDAPRSARAAARHYTVVGGRRRSPSVDFDGERYASNSPDIADAGLNPLVHYVRFGRREGREVRPHFERYFLSDDGRLDRGELEAFLRSGALTSGRGSVLRALPHLLHVMPRNRARVFGSILAALGHDRPEDLGPAIVSGPSRGNLGDVSVSIVGDAGGILATASLAALMVGGEVGREQVALPGEVPPDAEVTVEVTAGALVLPGSLARLAEHARRGGGPAVGVPVQADGAAWVGWDEPEVAAPSVMVARTASSIAGPPAIVGGATAVWWPDVPAAVAAPARPRVLVVDDEVPTPDLDSGSNCTLSYARTLASFGYRVQFVPTDLRFHPRYTPELESWGIEVIDERQVGSVGEVLRSGPYALALLVTYPVFDECIDVLRREQPGMPVLFAPLDLHHVRLAAQAALSTDERIAQDAASVRTLEIRAIQQADATIVLSSLEVTTAQALVPDARVALVPMARDRTALEPIPTSGWADRNDIVFVGSYRHPPNPDALEWFLDEVWPAVAEQLPDARFVAYGSGMPDALSARSTERTVMHGWVEHLDDAFASARIAVVPVRFGAGVKGKVTSGMLAGVPVVSSPTGIEGTNLEAPAIVVADGASGFVDAIVELWDDPERLSRISAAGLAEASTRFSFEAQRAAFATLLADLGTARA